MAERILTAALSYIRAGISIIPTHREYKTPYWAKLPQVPDPERPNRTKGIWTPYTWWIASEKTVRRWFEDDQANLSVVTGAVSGRLVVLDFDYEAQEIFPVWQNKAGTLATKLPVAQSGKGFHVYVRVNAAYQTEKLAYSEGGKLLIELRGEAALTQAPPSIHPSGKTYTWLHKDQAQIPYVTIAALECLLEAARQFDRRPPTPVTILPDLSKSAGTPPFGDDLEEKRLRAYAHKVIESETAVLAQTPCGSRNDALNRAAFVLGQYVSANLLSTQEAEAWLALACGEKGNRYIQDDGLAAFRRTLHSGLKAGLAVPDVRERLRQRLFVKEAE